ncbi:MAG: hypothetical protein IJV96_07195 [Clostridia bacterium]|nr:hypothetical protein [Clostridia bacterium]
MYIGRHPRPLTGSTVTEEGVSIPENYAGNAFFEPPAATEEERSAPPTENEQKDAVEGAVAAVAPTERRETVGTERSFFEKLLPRAEHLFSSDALLVFLAVLLAQSENDSDLSILLFLLLLF